jgi:hypothetical protein
MMNAYDPMLELGKDRMRDFHRESESHTLARESRKYQKRLLVHRLKKLTRLFNLLRARWLRRVPMSPSRPHDSADVTALSE